MELLLSISAEFLTAQRDLSARDQATQVPAGTPSASPDRVSADSRTHTEALAKWAIAQQYAAGGSSEVADAEGLSLPGKEKAAGVAVDEAEGASSEKLAEQGACITQHPCSNTTERVSLQIAHARHSCYLTGFRLEVPLDLQQM